MCLLPGLNTILKVIFMPDICHGQGEGQNIQVHRVARLGDSFAGTGGLDKVRLKGVREVEVSLSSGDMALTRAA